MKGFKMDLLVIGWQGVSYFISLRIGRSGGLLQTC